MKKHIIILTLMTVLFCTPAISKTFSTNRVDSKEDWSVFMENNPSQCWIVSAPSRTKATRNGKSVKVNRSEIQLFALFEPSQSIYGQISFTSGKMIGTKQLTISKKLLFLNSCQLRSKISYIKIFFTRNF